MRHVLSLVLALAFVGCGQEQTSVPQEEPVPVQNDPEPSTVKAEEDARKKMALMTVHEAVQGFKVIERRYPNNLNELINRGFLSALPELPLGMSFTYNAEAGEVAVSVREGTE